MNKLLETLQKINEKTETYHDEHLGDGPGDYVMKVTMKNSLGPFIKKLGYKGAKNKQEAVDFAHNHLRKHYPQSEVHHTDVFRYQDELDDPKKRGWVPPRF